MSVGGVGGKGEVGYSNINCRIPSKNLFVKSPSKVIINIFGLQKMQSPNKCKGNLYHL